MDISSIAAVSAASLDSASSRDTNQQQRELLQAVRTVNKAETFGPENELTFVFDRESRKTLLRIVDRETKEVVRQIPTEDVILAARRVTAESGAF